LNEPFLAQNKVLCAGRCQDTTFSTAKRSRHRLARPARQSSRCANSAIASQIAEPQSAASPEPPLTGVCRGAVSAQTQMLRMTFPTNNLN
jgi:hypothetical protein